MSIFSAKRREAILVLMYATFWDIQDRNALISSVHRELKISKTDVESCLNEVEEIAKVSLSIEGKLKRHCNCNWMTVGYLEKIILKLCCYELLYSSKVPRTVVISEGIRLAVKFSDKPSASFINAVLDSFCKKELN